MIAHHTAIDHLGVSHVTVYYRLVLKRAGYTPDAATAIACTRAVTLHGATRPERADRNQRLLICVGRYRSAAVPGISILGK